MSMPRIALLVLPLIGLLGACAPETVTNALSTGTVVPESVGAPVRGTQAIPGRPARVYVMAALEPGCVGGKAPVINIERTPTKGTVTFQPRQETTIQFSKSGSCVGQRVLGTGIYYTARAGEKGADSFTIRADTGDGGPVSQTFNVQIADPD